MDVTVLHVFYFLARLFVPMWCGGVLLGIIAAILWNGGERGKARCGKVCLALGCVLGPYLLALLGSMFILTAEVSDRFESLRAGQPGPLVLSSERGRTEITNQAEVRRLLDLIAWGDGVRGHHSHPVNRIVLSLPESGYAYALGRDSKQANVFWLEWVAYPGSGEARNLQLVRRFHSPELEDWLRQHHDGG